MSLPAYISNLIRDASDAQEAIAELLCQYQLAYRDMDDAVCLAPLYRGWSMETLLDKLSKLIQYENHQNTMQLTNCTVHIDQYVESQHIQTQFVGQQYTETQQVEHSEHLPAQNDYKGLYQWLLLQKEAGNDYLKDAGNNRTLLCKNLSHLLGWEVDANTLGKHFSRKKQ